MKSDEEVDALMAQIYAPFRYRWCGGERGPCACMGCVQVANRAIMEKSFTGREYRGDPEYIDEAKIPAEIRQQVKITKEEWEAWKSRYPEPTAL